MPVSSTRQFPDRLRDARERQQLSQAELAKKSGLQPSHISHFESGRRSPSFENLRALADALSVSTDYLLGRAPRHSGAGPIYDRVFRNAERLSAKDLETLASIAETLAGGDKARTR